MRNLVHYRKDRHLFARIGWMHFYNGQIPGDERPIGGGKFNKDDIGHEVFNFRKSGGYLFGYFQPSMQSHQIALERVDGSARKLDSLRNVTVIFVARHPDGGQVIVGWYKHAEVLRTKRPKSPGKPPGYGRFCTARMGNCVLLPTEERTFFVPKGRGGMGQSNVCYPLESSRRPKRAAWMERALRFVDDYNGPNILFTPEADAEVESAAAAEKAIARSKGQGFAKDARERRALEQHAMKAAIRYFRRAGFTVEDVSSRNPYDLKCVKRQKELHVEVKGTTTDGTTIVLTYNEVRHVQSDRNSVALFILHSIRLNKKNASGGKLRVLMPWRVGKRHLKPVSYTYQVSG